MLIKCTMEDKGLVEGNWAYAMRVHLGSKRQQAGGN